MIFAYIILGFSAIVASFIVGAHYGRAAEHQAIAKILRVGKSIDNIIHQIGTRVGAIKI